jgi:hypothetical protein
MVLIHWVDALDIYGISELWTHIVADLFDAGGATPYIDSYGAQVARDFPAVDVRRSTLDERMEMLGPKIVITER